MSIVGTRPPLISETNLYEPRHKARLAIKPGITGMWQVSGRSDITDFEEVVRLDKEYIENWDIGLDIKILLKTVMVVVNGISDAFNKGIKMATGDLIGLINADDYLFPHALANLTLACHECTDSFFL